MGPESLAKIYILHIKELQLINRTLIYGIFVITFAFYYAFFVEPTFKKSILNDMWMVVLITFVGSFCWCVLSLRMVHTFCSITDKFVKLSGCHEDSCIGAGRLYYLGSSSLIAINWVLFTAVLLVVKSGKENLTVLEYLTNSL